MDAARIRCATSYRPQGDENRCWRFFGPQRNIALALGLNSDDMLRDRERRSRAVRRSCLIEREPEPRHCIFGGLTLVSIVPFAIVRICRIAACAA
jgi:hypothetical protein